MSMEGYYEFLCENGHLSTADIYVVDYDCFKNIPCLIPNCNSAIVWENLVDQTNGTDENDPSTMPAKLEIKSEAEHCTCICGNTHIVKYETYHIPIDDRNKTA